MRFLKTNILILALVVLWTAVGFASQDETFIITDPIGLNFRTLNDSQPFVKPFKAIPMGWQVRRLDDSVTKRTIGGTQYDFIKVEFCPHSPNWCEEGYVANDSRFIKPAQLVADSIQSIKARNNRGGVNAFQLGLSCQLPENTKMNIEERKASGWVQVSIPMDQPGLLRNCDDLELSDDGKSLVAMIYPNPNFVEFSSLKFDPSSETEAQWLADCDEECNKPSMGSGLERVEGQAANLAQIASLAANMESVADVGLKLNDTTVASFEAASSGITLATDIVADEYNNLVEEAAERQRQELVKTATEAIDTAQNITRGYQNLRADATSALSRQTAIVLESIPEPQIQNPGAITLATAEPEIVTDDEATTGSPAPQAQVIQAAYVPVQESPRQTYSGISDESLNGSEALRNFANYANDAYAPNVSELLGNLAESPGRDYVNFIPSSASDKPQILRGYYWPVPRGTDVDTEAGEPRDFWSYRVGRAGSFGRRPYLPAPGASRDHKGLDIKASLRTPLSPAKTGTIIKASNTIGTGYRIEICHLPETGATNSNCKVKTTYSHLTAFRTQDIKSSTRCNHVPQVGTQVTPDDQIGCTGNTTGGSRSSSGAHLHFEIVENGVYKNPLPQDAPIQYFEQMDASISGQFTNILSRLPLVDPEAVVRVADTPSSSGTQSGAASPAP